MSILYTDELARKVHDYFKSKMDAGEPLTAEESQIYKLAEDAVGEFPVCCLTVDDLEEKGFDTSNLDKRVISKLANKLGDSMVDDSYWFNLEYLARDRFEIPLK